LVVVYCIYNTSSLPKDNRIKPSFREVDFFIEFYTNFSESCKDFAFYNCPRRKEFSSIPVAVLSININDNSFTDFYFDVGDGELNFLKLEGNFIARDSARESLNVNFFVCCIFPEIKFKFRDLMKRKPLSNKRNLIRFFRSGVCQCEFFCLRCSKGIFGHSKAVNPDTIPLIKIYHRVCIHVIARTRIGCNLNF
jgi:hypothetical protein